MAKNPCWARTRPCPAQVLQVVGLEPAFAPEPAQASQVTEVGSLMRRGLAVIGFLEGDLEIVAQVGAALLAGAAARRRAGP